LLVGAPGVWCVLLAVLPFAIDANTNHRLYSELTLVSNNHSTQSRRRTRTRKSSRSATNVWSSVDTKPCTDFKMAPSSCTGVWEPYLSTRDGVITRRRSLPSALYVEARQHLRFASSSLMVRRTRLFTVVDQAPPVIAALL